MDLAAVLAGLLLVGVLGGLFRANLIGAVTLGMARRRRGAWDLTANDELDALLNGSDRAVYEAPDYSGGISTPILARGAQRRGYRLLSETGDGIDRVVVFERVKH